MTDWSDYESGRMGVRSWFRIRTYGPVEAPELRNLIARLEQNLVYACIRQEPQMLAADLGLPDHK